MTYVVALLFRQGLGSRLVAFSSVKKSAHTLFFTACLLDDTKKMSDMIAEESALFSLGYITFIFLSAFTILNMLVGVLVDVINRMSKAEKLRVNIEFVRATIVKVLREIDRKGEGKLTRLEFDKLVSSPQVRVALAKLEVDLDTLISLADIDV